MMQTSDLSDLGWQPFFEQQVSSDEKKTALLARVMAHYGNRILFRSCRSEFNCDTSLIESSPSSGASEVAVGDWFLLDADSHRSMRRLERKTWLARKAPGTSARLQSVAANVDTCWIVCSCNQDFNLSRIERYLALVNQAGCQPVVVLTKSDLHQDPTRLRQTVEKIQSGLVVELMDARDPQQVSILSSWCGNGQTVALLGSSGVGKSTLVNVLGTEQGSVKTAEIRAGDDKGRHTTTARILHRMSSGGWLLDNPGMRELQISNCEASVSDLFQDVDELAQKCRFRNCSHQDEPGCAIQAAIANEMLDQRRLSSFQKLKSEQARNSATLAERREKDRKMGAFYKSVITEKKRRREG